MGWPCPTMSSRGISKSNPRFVARCAPTDIAQTSPRPPSAARTVHPLRTDKVDQVGLAVALSSLSANQAIVPPRDGLKSKRKARAGGHARLGARTCDRARARYTGRRRQLEASRPTGREAPTDPRAALRSGARPRASSGSPPGRSARVGGARGVDRRRLQRDHGPRAGAVTVQYPSEAGRDTSSTPRSRARRARMPTHLSKSLTFIAPFSQQELRAWSA